MFTQDEIVAVCYDGKWSRAVEGRVISVGPTMERIATLQKWIKVRFKPWANEAAGFVEIRCEPRGPNDDPYFGGWLKGDGELGIMQILGCRGDWYSVIKAKKLADANYPIEAFDRESSES